MEVVIDFCNTRPGLLNLRYTRGEWMAQLVALDGSFTATAINSSLDAVFEELETKVTA